MTEHVHPNIEPLHFADNRVTLGPDFGLMIVDDHALSISRQPFIIAHTLAQHLDDIVQYPQLIKEVWGWELETVDTRMKTMLQRSMMSLRKSLGEELGCSRWGAIRPINKIGYMALRHL